MEIEINTKKNNILLGRTEVYFTINHTGEKTPNREIIQTELADILNAKKSCIIIDNICSETGIQKSRGYAKVYSSIKKAQDIERIHIQKRNKIIVTKEEKNPIEKKQPEKEEKPLKETPPDREKQSEKEGKTLEETPPVEKKQVDIGDKQ
jgi:small subunit ribosomal protein S24e